MTTSCTEGDSRLRSAASVTTRRVEHDPHFRFIAWMRTTFGRARRRSTQNCVRSRSAAFG